jgi:hypothetical protein
MSIPIVEFKRCRHQYQLFQFSIILKSYKQRFYIQKYLNLHLDVPVTDQKLQLGCLCHISRMMCSIWV